MATARSQIPAFQAIPSTSKVMLSIPTTRTTSPGFKVICRSVEDALKAFEAYYHYVAISCFDQAASVILKKINIQFAKDYKLGRALYKLGFLQPIISATTRIVNNVTSDYYLSGLYSILGVSYRILCDINQAI